VSEFFANCSDCVLDINDLYYSAHGTNVVYGRVLGKVVNRIISVYALFTFLFTPNVLKIIGVRAFVNNVNRKIDLHIHTYAHTRVYVCMCTCACVGFGVLFTPQKMLRV
jgi:hypothetical protein